MREFINIIEGMSTPYRFVATCVNGGTDYGHGPWGEAVTDMVDRSKEISYSTFVRYVGPEQIKDVFPDYNRYMPMKNDYHVGYYKSTWFGIPCVYVVHSTIEYIFTISGDTPESRGIDREDYVLDLD